MKAVILAGGLGSRLSEETQTKPKPMVEIGDRPILWHIMKIYSHFGINDFIICLGYKGYYIKEYFFNYLYHNSDISVDLQSSAVEILDRPGENWRVQLIDTGAETMTGGRLKRILPFVGDEDFCFTYGDGVADIDIGRLLDFHRAGGRLCTVTAVQPPGRFGVLELDQDSAVASFREKPAEEVGWINGGFFVASPKIGDYIEGDATIWEREPLERLTGDGQLGAFVHRGFWRPMDTLRDKQMLEDMVARGTAPWMTWPGAAAKGG